MKNTGYYGWSGFDSMTPEQRKQRTIRSLELQIVDKERELSRLRAALADVQR